MNKGYYLVSKPLQYFNVTNIEGELQYKTCLIVDVFYKAEDFFNNIKKQNYWDDVLFFSSSKEAYEWLKTNIVTEDFLYIDSDYGLKKTIWLSKIKSKNIYVYEEGTGSYRDDLIKMSKNNSIMRFFLKLIGFKEHMGGGRYTKGIIIYDVEKHKIRIPKYRKVRKSFKYGFMEQLPLIKHHFAIQMSSAQDLLATISNKKVLLYLTSWEYNTNVDAVMDKYPHYIKIIKPHPHIKTKYTQSDFNYVLSNEVFVEIFLVEAVNFCEEVVVLHENSSALQYISSDNLKSVLL